MERCDEGVVGLVEEGEGFCAVGVGFVEFDAVVDDGVGLEVLCGGLVSGVCCVEASKGGRCVGGAWVRGWTEWETWDGWNA